MCPNLNLHMATAIWLMRGPGIYCCGPAPRVAGQLPSLWSLWDFCLPSLWLLLLRSLRGSLSMEKMVWTCWWHKENGSRLLVIPFLGTVDLRSADHILWVELVSQRTWSKIDSDPLTCWFVKDSATFAVCIYVVLCEWSLYGKYIAFF